MDGLLYTIGHSNQSLEDFLRLLESHQIEVVADVRTAPRSRYVPWFDKPALKEALVARDIGYVFLGAELGGRPSEESMYDDDGHVLYGRVAASDPFREGLGRLENGMRDHRVAIMCAEEDPTDCHRRLLVAKVLLEWGVRIEHIRKGGRLEAEAGVGPPPALFDNGEQWWRSTQSVSQRPQRLTSFGG